MSASVWTSPEPSAARRLMVRHPVTAFFVLAYAGTWLFLLPMVLSQEGVGLLHFRVPFALYVILFLLSSFSGPTLAAFVVTNALEGREGMARLLRRYGQWRVGILPYLIVLFLFPLIWLQAAIIALGFGPVQAVVTHPLALLTTYLPALLIFPALITWGEEPGWRGFALTRLQPMYGPLRASLVVGVLHELWHLPTFFLISGPPAAGPFNVVNLLRNMAVVLLVTIIFTWVFNMARGSVLIAVLMHASFNAAPGWIFGLVGNPPPATSYIGYGILALIALVLIAATRGRLGYRSPGETATEETARPAALPGA